MQFGIEILRQRGTLQNPVLGGTSNLLRVRPRNLGGEKEGCLPPARLNASVLNTGLWLTKCTCGNDSVIFKLQKVSVFYKSGDF